MFTDISKKWLLIGGAVLIAVLILAGIYRAFLGTRAFPHFTESVIGGTLKGSKITEGTYRLEFRGKTDDGKTVSDTVTFSAESAPASPPPSEGPSPSPAPDHALFCGNRVANGSFEAPVIQNPSAKNLWQVFTDIPGWTPRSPYQVELQATGLFGRAHSGRQYAEIDDPGSVNLSQTVATTAGHQYRLRFFYALRPKAGPQRVGVYWNGQLIGNAGGTPTQNTIVWQEKTFTVTAQGDSSTLGFGSLRGNGVGNFIDTVSLTRCPA